MRSFRSGNIGRAAVEFEIAARRPDQAYSVGGHLGEVRGLQGNAVNESYPGNQQAAALQHGELPGCRRVMVTALAEMNQEGVELMVFEALAYGGKIAFRHLQGKDVVSDMPVVFGIEIMGKPSVASVGLAADDGGLTLGQSFDFGIALHLASKVVGLHPRMGGLDQGLVNRLLLPVIAIAELLVWMPAREHIVSKMVVQVDEPGRDHPMCIDGGYMRGKFHFGPDGDDLALADKDCAVLDDTVGRDQGAAQCQIVARLRH